MYSYIIFNDGTFIYDVQEDADKQSLEVKVKTRGDDQQVIFEQTLNKEDWKLILNNIQKLVEFI